MTQIRLNKELDLASLFQNIAEHSDNLVWLDSARGDPELGKRSVLTLAVEPALTVDATSISFWSRKKKKTTYSHDQLPDQSIWKFAEKMLSLDSQNTESELGWVGYLAYEAASLADPGQPPPREKLSFPPISFYRVTAAILADKKGFTLAFEGNPHELPVWKRWINENSIKKQDKTVFTRPISHIHVQNEPDPKVHKKNVRSIINHIESGRIFQACYTFPIWFERPKSLIQPYLALRKINAGDYGAYLRFGDLEVASTSPERYLTLQNKNVRARPMKGTRPRIWGKEKELRDELYNSSKDRAENVMIVDLLRNDIGRVCEIGSVKVTKLFNIETYDTVFQMTSTIEGILKKEFGVFSLIAATFPPGSMTGAPKVEACYVLDELESAPRGVYSGSIMWLGYNKQASMSVVIRTLQAYGNIARWDVGGGIVADSDPEDEWEEALIKATAAYRIAALARG